MRQKAELPEKICASCGRPFAWRKKWARDWAQVRYCSDACRKRQPGKGAARMDEGAPLERDGIGT